MGRRATGIGEHNDGYLRSRLPCYTWERLLPGHGSRFPALPAERQMGYSGHLTVWPAITTLHRYKRRVFTKHPSHVDTPYSIPAVRALVRPPRPSSKRTGTLGRTLSYQDIVYGRRRLYMKDDPPHGQVSLRDLGRGASAGHQSLPAGRRWQQALPGLLSSSLGVSLARR